MVGGTSEGLGVVGRHSWRVCRHSLMAGSGWEALQVADSGREALLEGREWSGGSPGGPGVVGRPAQRAGTGLEVLSVVRESSGGPP